MLYFKYLTKTFCLYFVILSFVFPSNIFANPVLSPDLLVETSKKLNELSNVRGLVDYFENNNISKKDIKYLKNFLTKNNISPSYKLPKYQLIGTELHGQIENKKIVLSGFTEKDYKVTISDNTFTIPLNASFAEIEKIVTTNYKEKAPTTTSRIFNLLINESEAQGLLTVLYVFLGIIAVGTVASFALEFASVNNITKGVTLLNDCSKVDSSEVSTLKNKLDEAQAILKNKCGLLWLAASNPSANRLMQCSELKERLKSCRDALDKIGTSKTIVPTSNTGKAQAK